MISIVIPTRNRASWLNDCIQHLLKQEYDNFEIVVVDSSTDEVTKTVISQKYPQIRYFFLPNGLNKRPESKNIGIKHAKGEIVAFIDDDSLVQDGWLKACAESYTSDNIGAAGGLIIDKNVENSEGYSSEAIGRLTYNGTRIGNFFKDPGRIIEVDHLRGCNMSFKKSALVKAGGFDINYTGSNVLEETDLCIKIKKLGYKILFNPKMAVIHTTAPREIVMRKTYDFKRNFYIARNSTYFMIKNFDLTRTMSYIFTNNTGIISFFKKPGLRLFTCIIASIFGKITGFAAGIKFKIIR
ncbi:MAG: hypothetical protein COV72_02945 [Candidatus Omnitrophica bacterium CG11_big_fil_rev_8_21_14_0_20_42_13]|uniref:Glycosyltransferase 2-like domain-containing protein n=1 Tax=Candidatus Ghiorseimicrobium undicola TaxID=1974746 RepID=A0A2H0LYH6_9BACT|nr:MAG: hypothetical protein COV72_02945 [Candidatus Omnitrophica bacterium CG11_big_fil_rev_8_21_14_0_20_42_13]